MITNRSHQLMVFCDGGIGNRINSLISGLALARHFNLSYCIYWPENNWCQAAFHDIFKNNVAVSHLSIKDLSGSLDQAVALLHDEIASNSLGIKFNSAYQYSSLEDFSEKVLSVQQEIFFYPAVMPPWIPFELAVAELRTLSFTDHIHDSVCNFINNTLQKPFHGLHLRRTDLNVGLNDHEVLNLVSRHPEETFFVCSDDPVAESMASAHPNVHARNKNSHVTKKYNHGDWLSQSVDDDGRLYFGNIQRNKEAVIEGAIDLLILAHSQIVGYSGSTFQRIAKIIGESRPFLSIDKPKPLNYFSPTEIQKQINANLISSKDLLSICNSIGSQGDMQEAISLLQKASAHFDGGDYLDILHTLGVFFLNQNQPKIARLYLREVISNDSNRYSSWVHLAYSHYLNSDLDQSLSILNLANSYRPIQPMQSDINIEEFLTAQSTPTNSSQIIVNQ